MLKKISNIGSSDTSELQFPAFIQAVQAQYRKGYSCSEGRLMGPNNNWHCTQIGGFPRNIPGRQQTISKIANCTGLGCFKSLTVYSWSCCELLLQPVNGNHLVGSERGLALSYAGPSPFILGLTHTVSICVSM